MRVWVYDSFLQQHNAQVNNLLYTITFYSIFSPSESDGWCPFLSRNTWSRTAARYSHQIFDFSGTFARPRVTCTFLTVYQLSYTLDILLSWQFAVIHYRHSVQSSWFCQSCADLSQSWQLTSCLREFFHQIRFAPHPFLTKKFSRTVFFARERHV